VCSTPRVEYDVFVMSVAGLRLWPISNACLKRLQRLQQFISSLPATQVSSSFNYFWKAPGHPYLSGLNALVLLDDAQQLELANALNQRGTPKNIMHETFDFLNSLGFTRKHAGVGGVSTFFFSAGLWNANGHRLCKPCNKAKRVVEVPFVREAWDVLRTRLDVCVDTTWVNGRNADARSRSPPARERSLTPVMPRATYAERLRVPVP
jgi:hypothetical protein